MSIFDLVLILSVLLSLGTLLAAAGLAATGRFGRAGRLLRAWGLGVAAYLIVVIVVSLFTRPRQLAVGEDVCFDDWCIAVERVERAHDATPRSYAITFRLSSRARRVSQRERYLAAYLRDEHGQRYDPRPVVMGEPFDVLLAPGQTVHTSRAYDVPPDPLPLRLVITHEGGFPIGWFIIGQGPFGKGIQMAMP